MGNGNCVEIPPITGGVVVRDSKNPVGQCSAIVRRLGSRSPATPGSGVSTGATRSPGARLTADGRAVLGESHLVCAGLFCARVDQSGGNAQDAGPSGAARTQLITHSLVR